VSARVLLARVGAGLVASLPAALAGGFFALVVLRASEPEASRLALLVLGGLYGIGVRGLMRLFRVAPFALPIAGLVAGPVPIALVMGASWSSDDRGGALVLGAVLGLVVGVLEWGRLRRAAGPGSEPDVNDS